MASVLIEGIDKGAPRGALDAHVSGDRLQVPRHVAELLRSNGVRTAEDLISYFDCFPSGAAALLEWSSSEVTEAAAELRAELKGHDEAYEGLGDPWIEPPLGALNPDDLP